MKSPSYFITVETYSLGTFEGWIHHAHNPIDAQSMFLKIADGGDLDLDGADIKSISAVVKYRSDN